MKLSCLSFNKSLGLILFAAGLLSAPFFHNGCSENKNSGNKNGGQNQTDSLNSSGQNSTSQNPSGQLSASQLSVNTLQNLNCTGYIKAVSAGTSANYAVIDTVEWFSGDEALKAYSIDKKKKIPNLPDPPQGFYIRNPKTDSLKIKISGKPEIIMQTLSFDTSSGNFKFNESISLQKFLSIFSKKEYAQFRQKPFSFKIINGEIISIKEKYIP